ncbi:MAG TPA: hypothetical protein VJR47_21635 [Stellaceae bacterium]|nr:hypothetical protein [Stellaceae bacterium]
MKLRSTLTALTLAFSFGVVGISSIAAAHPAHASDAAMTQPRSTGVYDSNDRFKDAEGFPLPGWVEAAQAPL